MTASSVVTIILPFMPNTTKKYITKGMKSINFITYIDLINVCLHLLLVYTDDENEF